VTSKREREYERRRLEKWEVRHARNMARRRRWRIVGWAITGVLALAVVLWVVISATSDSPAPVPTTTTTAPAPDTTTAATPAPTSTIDTSARIGNGGVLPDAALAQGRTWTGTIALNSGDLGIELDGAAAPQAVANFVTLAQEGFFDQTKCHRLVTSGIFVLQCGDPTATGTGGPGYTWGPIENAPSDAVYPAGTIAMARADDPASMGSQFFIVYADSTIPSDSGGYTVFGHVTSGLDVVQAIADAGTVTVGTFTAPVSDVIIEGVQTQ
jgi:peptidyl-prolyl cis-trans isomerase B (cyclophilin B)